MFRCDTGVCAQRVNSLTKSGKNLIFFVAVFGCFFAAGVIVTYFERLLLVIEKTEIRKDIDEQSSEKQLGGSINVETQNGEENLDDMRPLDEVWYIKHPGRKRKDRIGLRIEDDVAFIQIRVFASAEQTSQSTVSLTVTEFESLKILSNNTGNISTSFDHAILNGRRKTLVAFNGFNNTVTVTLFKHKDGQTAEQSGWTLRSLISITKETLKKITDLYPLILERINTSVLNNELSSSTSSIDGREHITTGS